MSDLSMGSSPRKSDDQDSEGELNLNYNELFFGDTFKEIGEEDNLHLENLDELMEQRNLLQDRTPESATPPIQDAKPAILVQGVSEQAPQQRSLEPAERLLHDDESNSSFEIDAEVPLMYPQDFFFGDDQKERVGVYQFSGLFIPTNEKLKRQFAEYNKHIIAPVIEHENEIVREQKRQLKNDYKQSLQMHAHKAQFTSIAPFIEDFFYLTGKNKQGLPISNVKTQKKSVMQHWHAQYKANHVQPFVGQSSNIAKILNIPSIEKKPQTTSKLQIQQAELDSAQEQFRQQAAKVGLLPPNLPTKLWLSNFTNKAPYSGDEETSASEITLENCGATKQMLEACQIAELETALAKEMPNTSEAEADDKKQIYAGVKAKIRTDLDQKFPVPMFDPVEKQCFSFLQQLKYRRWEKKFDTPSDNQMQQWIVSQKYVEAQKLANKSGLLGKRPIQQTRYWGELRDTPSCYQLARDNFVYKRAKTAAYDAQPKSFFVVQKHLPVAPVKQTNMFASLLKKPELPRPPAVVKTTHALVENCQEYETVQQQELKNYAEQSKTSQLVSAKSIMRHVRFKLGLIKEQRFYEEEYFESFQNQKPAQVYERSTNFDRMTPQDIEENLDVHFDRKRIKIKEHLILKKKRKESQSQQIVKPTATTAYEPICLVKRINEKRDEDDDRKNQVAEENSDEEGESSSDSDSSDDQRGDLHERQKRVQSRVTPSLGDELNHAKCIKDLSFCKLNWSEGELRTFHRPDISQNFSDNDPYSILNQLTRLPVFAVPMRKEETEKRLNPHDYFKEKSKLSLAKGKFCVFEHIDQHPLFLNNFGMASKLKRYYYGDKQPSKKIFKINYENRGTRHMGPYGEIVLKDPLEKLDLLGQIDQTSYKGLAVLENKMYNAPLFYHTPHATDFFCVVQKGSRPDQQRIVIREMDNLYTVGQLEPKLEVYNPQSRYYQNFIKQRCKAYIIRFLQENQFIYFQDIVNFFPLIGEPILKKSLKEIDVEVDRNGECKFNAYFDAEKFKDRMTPEMICQYESARHGQHRLEQLGITEILSADKISYSTNKFCQEETDLQLQRVAKLIESEVLATPWNLSSNYIKIKQEGQMMMLQGQGDPSFGYGGYSFLKMPLKISSDSLQGAKQTRMHLNPAIQNPKQVTGTDADLRKLQKKNIFDKLVRLGYDNERLRELTRWQMVAVLRHQAPNQDENKQYARGVRYTSKKQQEMYNQRANSNFKKQIDNLTELDPKYLHSNSESEPDFTTRPKGFPEVVKKRRVNATDFVEDIMSLQQDENKKFFVESNQDAKIEAIEDVPNYLKLLLVKWKELPVASTSATQSGIRMEGQPSQTQLISADFFDSLGAQEQAKLEKEIKNKLQTREKSKACKILCKKIKSLIQPKNAESDKPVYSRVIYRADSKSIKKFERCLKKSSQKTTRQKKFKTGTSLDSRSRGQLTQAALSAVGGARRNQNASFTASIDGGRSRPKSPPKKSKKNRSGSYRDQSHSNASRQPPSKGLVSVKIGQGHDSNRAIAIKMHTDQAFEPQSQPTILKVNYNPANPETRRTTRIPVYEEQKNYPQLQRTVSRSKRPQNYTSVASRFNKFGGSSKDDFEFVHNLQGSSRKRQQQYDTALNNLFLEVINELLVEDHNQYFHQQVTKQEAPTYRDFIQNPIALKDMRNKAKRNEYKTKQEFYNDLALMRTNAETFNGRQHPISLCAAQLEKFALDFTEMKNDEIVNLEAFIQQQMR